MQFIRTFFSRLSQLLDVGISSPSNGDVLQYNSSSGKWENGVASGGGAVSSVAGRTGDVTLSNSDISGLANSATITASAAATASTIAQRTSGGSLAASGLSVTGSNGSATKAINVVDGEGTSYASITAGGKVSGDGSGLTALNASNLSSGTVPNARLPNPSASSLGGIQSAAAVSHQWIDSISTSGVPHLSQPAASDISGLAASATIDTTDASNISSGTLSQSRFALATYSATGSGTAYTLTNTTVAVTFGTTSPTITIAATGTYLLLGEVIVHGDGTQDQGNTSTIKFRKTSGTAANVGDILSIRDGSQSSADDMVGNPCDITVHLLPFIYSATASDVLTIFAGNNSLAGGMSITHANITAVRLA